MKNTFFIYIKLLKTNPETGKCWAPPCEVQAQIIFNLYLYIHEFQMVEEDNSEAYENAIREILEKTHRAFECPLGWFIAMESKDEFFALDNPFYQPEVKFSEEFFYSPDHGKTAIDTEFMYRWAIETVQSRFAN